MHFLCLCLMSKERLLFDRLYYPLLLNVVTLLLMKNMQAYC